MSLADCTLCPNKEDPRFGLLTQEGDFYPLCDGCSPAGDPPEKVRAVADRCRALGAPFGNSQVIPRFGVDEAAEQSGGDKP